MASADLQELEAKLGHPFSDSNLLVRALTHRSYAFGNRSAEPSPIDNERLEFLGDAILGFLISEFLVLRHTSWPEGQLSMAKAYLVSAAHLHQVAQQLDLGRFLQLGRSEEMSGGRQKKMLLANAVEAIIAAMHIDGGIEVARRFVLEHVLGGSNFEHLVGGQETNYKSTLQERAQAVHLPQPQYVIVEETGPGHAKTFTVEARIGAIYRRQGSGASKKSAAQDAAKAILAEMDQALAGDSVDTNISDNTESP